MANSSYEDWGDDPNPKYNPVIEGFKKDWQSFLKNGFAIGSPDAGIIDRDNPDGPVRPGSSNDDGSGNDDGTGVTWYGSGGYGYASGGKTPEEIQEENQQQINNLRDMYGSPGRGGDLIDLFKKRNDNFDKQRDLNEDLFKSTLRTIQRTSWETPQQRLQSMVRALRDHMGNGVIGSGIRDLIDATRRAEDMSNYAQISSIVENERNAYDNYLQADTGLVDNINNLRTQTEDELSKLRMQFQQAIANINPELGSTENIKKAENGEDVTVGEGTDALTLPAVNLGRDEETKALLAPIDFLKAENERTYNYWRPDRAVNEANKIKDTGSYNQAMAANQGFLDNLFPVNWRV